MFCQTCGSEISEGTVYCGKCGKPVKNNVSSSGDSGIQTLIPYKNVPALVAYYLGIFSLIPLLGCPLGIAAFVLGIQGLKRAKQNPQAKGKVHAWIGIIMGGFFGIIVYLIAIIIIIGVNFKK